MWLWWFVATHLYLIFEDILSSGFAINNIHGSWFAIYMLRLFLHGDSGRSKSCAATTKVFITNTPILEILLTYADLISSSTSSISVLECLCQEDTQIMYFLSSSYLGILFTQKFAEYRTLESWPFPFKSCYLVFLYCKREIKYHVSFFFLLFLKQFLCCCCYC